MAEGAAFGDCELDPTRRLLLRRGRPVEVEARAFDLLLYLIERRDRVVSSAELLEALWPGTAVTPGALSRAVHKARAAVGDDGRAQQVIATVHGRGFRFVAALEPAGGARAGDGPFAEAKTRYARNGDVHIAYRVFGAGPRDIVLIPGTISHVELLWEVPVYAHLVRRLSAFARVIVFDKVGQGLSDRVSQLTLEERISDVRAVMDAAGSQRATLYGWSEGGQMSMMFAATYPERTDALILYGTYASLRHEPWLTQDQFERFLAELSSRWGQGALPRLYAPSARKDTALIEWFAKIERASASPGSMLALFRANYQCNVREILSAIQVPTLVLHRAGDRLVSAAAGRYLADHIPGARYRELPGNDHHVLDRPTIDLLANEIEEFVTGVGQAPEADRVLATLMVCDVVAAKPLGGEPGDRRWRELHSEFSAAARDELAAFRGREVHGAGEGLLATFDGPARAIRCACAIRERVRALGLRLRAGLHTGECELFGEGVAGIAVQIAARVAAIAAPGEVLVSSTVKDLVAGSPLRFADRGTHRVEDLPDEWRLYAVE